MMNIEAYCIRFLEALSQDIHWCGRREGRGSPSASKWLNEIKKKTGRLTHTHTQTKENQKEKIFKIENIY